MSHCYVSDVIKLAYSEIGYHEKASNKDLDDKTANSGSANFTKYARDLDNVSGFYNGKKNGFASCAIFVDWLVWMACGKDVQKTFDVTCQPARSAGAGAKESYQYFKKAGRVGKTPKVGANIFYTSDGTEAKVHHTGLVVGYDNSIVYTIESNVSNMTKKLKVNINSPKIYGYGYPKYDPEPNGKVVTPGDYINYGENNSTVVTDPGVIKTLTMATLTTKVVAIGKVDYTSMLNVRRGPGVNYDQLKSIPSIPKGKEIGICCALKASNGKLWYYVLIDNKVYGFVSSSYIVVKSSSSSTNDNEINYANTR